MRDAWILLLFIGGMTAFADESVTCQPLGDQIQCWASSVPGPESIDRSFERFNRQARESDRRIFPHLDQTEEPLFYQWEDERE